MKKSILYLSLFSDTSIYFSIRFSLQVCGGAGVDFSSRGMQDSIGRLLDKLHLNPHRQSGEARWYSARNEEFVFFAGRNFLCLFRTFFLLAEICSWRLSWLLQGEICSCSQNGVLKGQKLHFGKLIPLERHLFLQTERCLFAKTCSLRLRLVLATEICSCSEKWLVIKFAFQLIYTLS